MRLSCKAGSWQCMRDVQDEGGSQGPYLEDGKYVFEQYALGRKVGKLAQGLFQLYLKTATCQCSEVCGRRR